MQSAMKNKGDDADYDINLLLDDMLKVIIDTYRETNRLNKDTKMLPVPESYDADAISMLHNIQLSISDRTTELQYIQNAGQLAKEEVGIPDQVRKEREDWKKTLADAEAERTQKKKEMQ